MPLISEKDGSDAKSVDSWGGGTHATVTTQLVPHEGGGFYCPRHEEHKFEDRNALCPECEKEFQRARSELIEKQASVQLQLQELSMGGAGDILDHLQASMKQWKPQAAEPETQPLRRGASGNIPKAQAPSMVVNQPNLPPPPPPTPIQPVQPMPHIPQPQLPQVLGAQHPASALPPRYPGVAVNNQGAPSPPHPSHMNGGMHPAPPTPFYSMAPPSSIDALAMQIQRMQQMQDWMLWQKENECQQLRSRLEEASHELNQLRVDNALLHEKLHQQEQRMQHELRLIKLTALQSRRKSDPKYQQQIVVSPSPNELSQYPESNGYHVSSHQPPLDDQDPPLFPPDGGFFASMAQANVTSSRSASTGTGNTAVGAGTGGKSVDDSAATDESDEGKDVFDSTSITWPATNSVASASSARRPVNKQAYKHKVGPLTAAVSRTPPTAVSPPSSEPSATTQAIQPSVRSSEETKEEVKSSDNPWNIQLRPVRKDEEEWFDTQSVPKDIDVDGEAPPTVPLEENISFGTSIFGAHGDKKSSASTPSPPAAPVPEQARTTATESTTSGFMPPRFPLTVNKQVSATPIISTPSTKVSFVDDSASVGHTVASSTFGEDRVKVVNQTILDPYGDKGTYTGIILRSTGMPHGSGDMFYQEDKRTYAGEWRHGRWHGFGRASFANGDTYEGEYRFDQRHGRGIYQWSDGRVYDGMFREDKRHGKGKFVWPDGAIYNGEFRNGQREGQGTYIFSDGGKYEGSWKDGRYSGFGICSWEDGRCYKGEWLFGQANGKGIETLADGSVRHEGLWCEDEPVVES